MWNLFVGKGRKVEEIAPGDVSRAAKALGALGDWKGIVGLLQSMSTEGGGLLPLLNRLRYGGRTVMPGARPTLETASRFCSSNAGLLTYNRRRPRVHPGYMPVRFSQLQLACVSTLSAGERGGGDEHHRGHGEERAPSRYACNRRVEIPPQLLSQLTSTTVAKPESSRGGGQEGVDVTMLA